MNLLADGWIETVLGVIIFFISLAIIASVLVQKEKGGGLSGAFGGSGSTATFGVKTSDVLEKFTWFLFILFVVCTFSMAAAYSPKSHKTATKEKETPEKEAIVSDDSKDKSEEKPKEAPKPKDTKK